MNAEVMPVLFTGLFLASTTKPGARQVLNLQDKFVKWMNNATTQQWKWINFSYMKIGEPNKFSM